MPTQTRVLVVEDEPVVALQIELALEKAGYLVAAIVNSGEQALQYLQDAAPGIVLMDIELSGNLNGIETAAAIRRIHDIPIIYLTGHTERTIVDQAKATDPTAYLLKPFRDETLSVSIEMALHKHAIEIQLRKANASLAQEVAQRTEAEGHLRIILGEVRKQQHEIAALLQAARSILATQHFEVIARQIFDACKEVIGATSGYVALLSKDGTENEVLFLDAGGLPCAVDPARPMPIRGLRGEAYRTGKAVYDNAFPHSPWQQFMPDGHVALANVLFAPLMLEGQTVGLIGLANKPDNFTDADARVASAFAEFVALALLNSRSVEELEQHRNNLQGLVDERTGELQQANRQLAREIEDRRQAERTAQRAKEDAERANRAKSEFLANMSHELRTPLNVILGMAEIAQDQYDTQINAQTHHYISKIQESGRHLLQLINDVLDLSKISAGKIALEAAPLSIKLLCESSLMFIRQPALNKRIAVHTNYAQYPIYMQGDTLRLKQVLVNLLANAVKFTPEGGNIGLDVEPDAGRQQIRLIVWDSGIGIAEQDFPRLFRPFEQLDGSHTRQYEGTGLGLALVQRLVELHAGTISVNSVVGKGSRFIVTLPWDASSIAASAGTGRESPAASPDLPRLPEKGARSGAKILIAEDHAENLRVMAEYLTMKGYRLSFAQTGQEAVDRVKLRPPDLILMDIQMPEMDGIEAIRQIRADAALRGLPIIALTALAMPGDRERCLAAGANAYLSKPVRLQELHETIISLLAH